MPILDIHNTRQLRDLTLAFHQAQDGAEGLRRQLLAVQIGAAGLMQTLGAVAKALGVTFAAQKKTALNTVRTTIRQAKRELASFDELNRLGDPPSAASGTAANGPPLDVAGYMDTVHRLTIYLSGALLALGAILALSGANVPLGLGLMAAGAVGLAAVAGENWNAMTPGVRQALTQVLTALGGASLALGAILAFSGANVPLGLGLLAAGALGLGGAAALNWEAVQSALRGPLGRTAACVSGALLALGAILAFSGANLPLGLGLMAAGAAGLATLAAVNWDYIPAQLRKVWEGIQSWWRSRVAPCFTREFWLEKFAALGQALTQRVRDGLNAAIALLNRFVGWVNRSLNLRWGSLSLFGKTVIPSGSFQLLSLPQIPMLARGAVIPPNAPFLAMLGDQNTGRNIEAPESLLRQIVREETQMQLQQDFTFDVQLDGLTLARRLYRYDRQVRAERGVSLIEGGV